LQGSHIQRNGGDHRGCSKETLKEPWSCSVSMVWSALPCLSFSVCRYKIFWTRLAPVMLLSWLDTPKDMWITLINDRFKHHRIYGIHTVMFVVRFSASSYPGWSVRKITGIVQKYSHVVWSEVKIIELFSFLFSVISYNYNYIINNTLT